MAFFRVGLFTFGGGLAMLPMLEAEMRRYGLSRDEIYNYFSLGQSLPGVIAVNSASFIGRRVGGTLGAVVATLAVIAPSYGVIVAVILFFQNHMALPLVQATFSGIRSAAAALILCSGLVMLGKNIFSPATKSRLNFFNLAVFVITLILVALKVNPFIIVILALVLGFLRYMWLRRG
jgi:chromate transporter